MRICVGMVMRVGLVVREGLAMGIGKDVSVWI